MKFRFTNIKHDHRVCQEFGSLPIHIIITVISEEVITFQFFYRRPFSRSDALRRNVEYADLRQWMRSIQKERHHAGAW
ncbi:hypothetical protein U27_06134 [Candidatus Vecturithrix granuli]|uniref:Uncharacterized protein n=1 Tax=Vecturithrix granuli TaxID=1499967 RepID=A0A081C3K3_VECG1|nr:hypothetical protein U27_06134 [Candidatus Vecturithrix granuli]